MFRPRARGGLASQTVWMQIPDDQIDDFTRSWEIVFNERLTLDEARTKATELLGLFGLLAQSPSGEGFSTPPELGVCKQERSRREVAHQGAARASRACVDFQL